MKYKLSKNKKGILPIFIIAIAILGILFLLGGGMEASYKIGGLLLSIIAALSKLPGWAWIVIGLIVLFKLIGRKK